MSPYKPLPVALKASGKKAGQIARLLESYPLWVGIRVNGVKVGRVVIPEGFVTDFASVPNFGMLWRWFPPWGEYMLAAVAHDYLYYTGKYPRLVADNVFLHLMKKLGVGWWRRQCMYSAVRMFGGAAWNGHRKGRRPHGEGATS